MSNLFFISDTHWGHRSITSFEAEYRPFASLEEHDECLIDRWNSIITKRDTIWHLGDVFFGRPTAERVLPRLNGNKKLILGNHDRYPIEVYAKHFSKIFGVAKVHDCVLSHVPVHPNQKYRFRANIHGHLHSRFVTRTEPGRGDWRDPWYINVCVEHWNLMPVPWGELQKLVPIKE